MSWAYCIYIVIWELFVWGGTIYLIEWKGWSGWWVLFAIVLSTHCMKEKQRSKSIKPNFEPSSQQEIREEVEINEWTNNVLDEIGNLIQEPIFKIIVRDFVAKCHKQKENRKGGRYGDLLIFVGTAMNKYTEEQKNEG